MSQPILATLRDVMPIRPLTHTEALHLAELQAHKLLALSGITEAMIPEQVITSLPKIEVKRMSPWPVSGATDWVRCTWVIILNAAEPITRQRFSLAHEFKHIIDHRFINVLYPATAGMDSHRRAEMVCDYFAGCLLMPRPWLKRAWASGMQDLARLAEHFGTSQAAVATRLSQTGLSFPYERCPGDRLLTREPSLEGATT